MDIQRFMTAGGLCLMLLAGGCSGAQTAEPPAPPQSLGPDQASTPDVELQQAGDGKVTVGTDKGSGEADSAARPE